MKCPHCDIFLVDLNAYQLHHSISHISQPFFCVRQCGRQYARWSCLKKHFLKCPLSFSSVISVPSVSAVTSKESVNANDNVSCDSPNSSTDFLFNTSEFSSCLRAQADKFVSNLYSKPKLPRQYVQNIVDDVSSFISDALLVQLKSAILSILPTDQTPGIECIFNAFQYPFSHLSTEYYRFKYFMESGDFIPPAQYEIGQIDVSVNKPDGAILTTKKCYGTSVPINLVLKRFLEIPNAFNEIMSYVNSLENDPGLKQNFTQSRLWKTKLTKFPKDTVVLPLHMYFDEFQCNNPLGSHTEKLGGVYVSIPCLPPQCQSSVDNIFVALVFPTAYRSFSDERAFAPFISQLKSLEEEGIIVQLPDGPKKVFFVSGLLLGDNLGLNSVGGFAECFTANFYCRFCKSHRCEMESQCVESTSLLRTEKSYGEDLLVNDTCRTGVKTDSIFNKLPSFHITANYSVDIFHDLCEGICHYTMSHVLVHCIPKYFTLDVLNNRIEMFRYGPCDSNIIPFVSNNFAMKKKLQMSGSETLLFVKMFGILVGDKVPVDDPFWILYLKLCELLDLCLSKCLPSNASISFRVIAREFNEMYLLVTKDSLKPKMHFLVHYSSVFNESGPVALMSTKRFESKHRTLLIPAHATQSRRQICYTVAVQHQLNLCFKFKSKSSILPETEFGSVHEVVQSDFVKSNFVKTLPPNIFSSTLPCLSANWVKFKGTKFKPGMVLLLSVSAEGSPVFGMLQSILNTESSILFVFIYLSNLGFDDHLHAFEIELSEKCSFITPCELYDPLPLSIHHSVLGKKYVSLRYAI